MTTLHTEPLSPRSPAGACARPQAAAAVPASRLPSTAWIPLDAIRQAWAAFGAKEITTSGLAAVSSAFLALSWEAGALHHHTWAWQEARQGRSRNAAYWLEQAIQELTRASHQWSRAYSWLERQAHDAHEAPAELAPLRSLIGQAREQQQRLWQLVQEVHAELIQLREQPPEQRAWRLGRHGRPEGGQP